MAAGIAIGFESPPLPALKGNGQLPASIIENRYLLGIALRRSAGRIGHRSLDLENISTEFQ